jgi:hypothetical protein
MIRRIGVAGAGLLAFLLPACVSNWNPTDPYWVKTTTGAPTPNYQPNRLSGQTIVSNASPYGRVMNPPRIADGQLPMVQAGGTGLVEARSNEPTPQPAELPGDLETPKESPVSLPDSPKPSGTLTLPKATVQPPTRGDGNDNVIRPQWPNLGGGVVETSSSAKPLEQEFPEPIVERHSPPSKINQPTVDNSHLLPPLDAPQPRQESRASLQFEQNSTPNFPAKQVQQSQPVPSPAETVLIRAMRAFQNNRPEEGAELLRQLDPTNQDVLNYLMPLMVRLGEGNIQNLPPEELSGFVDRLSQATTMLKTRAGLRLGRVCFCRAVRKFGDVDTFEPQHEFKPGDMVHLYLEIANFTSEPVLIRPSGANGEGSPPHRSFRIKLLTRLEINDPQGRPVVNFELPKTDHARTPPQDYYHTYRLTVPETLPPGNYTLWVTVSDMSKPNNPPVRQAVELRVARN